ncbi:MAG: isopenicillin N synthase family oxygenase [Myxococcales bacterium]|nr:isopenicillin N synthase family oxygenase [Myxococcales bacterium]
MSEQSIPVVSLKDYTHGTAAQRDAFVETVGGALVDVGFFGLEDHGVPQELVDAAYACTRQLFALNAATKDAYVIEGCRGQRGMTRFGMEHAKDSAAPDLKEFWQVGRDLPEDHPRYRPERQNPWPGEIPAFRPTMLDLFGRLDAVSASLLEACSIYIGESPNLLRETAELGDTILRLIHYPPVPEDKEPSAVRAAAHEDINLITILCEATSGGLELLERDGSWRKVHALHGQFVVDSGDMLQQLTNGLFKSTTHRVVNPDNSRDVRFSMPFFVHPRPEVDLTPLRSCIERTGGVAKFPPMTADAYLQKRLADIGLGDM